MAAGKRIHRVQQGAVPCASSTTAGRRLDFGFHQHGCGSFDSKNRGKVGENEQTSAACCKPARPALGYAPTKTGTPKRGARNSVANLRDCAATHPTPQGAEAGAALPRRWPLGVSPAGAFQSRCRTTIPVPESVTATVAGPLLAPSATRRPRSARAGCSLVVRCQQTMQLETMAGVQAKPTRQTVRIAPQNSAKVNASTPDTALLRSAAPEVDIPEDRPVSAPKQVEWSADGSLPGLQIGEQTALILRFLSCVRACAVPNHLPGGSPCPVS